jgi:DNA (cytosine-5)-methyltransferase 1
MNPMQQITHGSLFSGIGGFDVGFERAGIRTIWQVEIDDFCRRVLARHFPDARRYDDVRQCCGLLHRTAELRAQCGKRYDLRVVDVLSGGFPCQDISFAGKGAGIDGERSGLWGEYKRLIRELRPRVAVVENVAALLNRGIDRVLGDLAEIGYDAEWQCIRAADVGAPHRRDRIWIAAYPARFRDGWTRERTLTGGEGDGLAKRDGKTVAHTDGRRREQCDQRERGFSVFDAGSSYRGFDQWATEPDVGRVAHGIPSRVDRLTGLGNAIVPQIAEIIGRGIVRTLCP